MSVLQSKYELLTNYPDVAKQWHPTKNGSKKPEEYRPGSHTKGWWLCDLNHEWEATIGNRSSIGRVCPHCYIKRRNHSIKT